MDDAHDVEGTPLGEALKRFSEPGEWEAYQEAQRRSLKSGIIVDGIRWDEPIEDYYRRMSSGLHSYREKNRQSEWLYWQLRRGLFAKIRKGPLVAYGYAIPRVPADIRIRIPADILHDHAEIDWRDSTIVSDGLNFASVLVFYRDEVPEDWKIGAGNDKPTESEPETQPVIPSGAPGRPSSMALVENEFQQRVDKGLTCPTLKGESKFLAEWIKRIPNAPSPTPKTIANRLRHKFNSLKAEKSLQGE